MKKQILVMLFCCVNILFAQLPQSREATLIEQVSSSEVMIEATGIYNGTGKKDKNKKSDVSSNGANGATLDAKKSAVYFMLYNGTDPLLRSTEEQRLFEEHIPFFFNGDNVNTYITFEEQEFRKRVKMNDGKSLKIAKRFKVNVERLRKDLEARNVLVASADLAESIGNPFIMVLPRVEKGKSPIEVLATDALVSHGAGVVQSYLTANQYEVIVPDQASALEALNSAQMDVKDRDEDIAYQLALAIGSDVYIDYKGSFEDAGYGTQRYSLDARAYETTTARLLGAETGYSQGRSGDQKVSVEEAMNDAIAKVLARVNEYWKKDLKSGVQYKLIISIAGSDFDEDDLEEIQFGLMDAIDAIANKSKENIVTDNTMDYLVWCNPKEYDKSTKIYRSLRKEFKDIGEDYGARLGRVNINRKMVLLKVDAE